MRVLARREPVDRATPPGRRRRSAPRRPPSRPPRRARSTVADRGRPRRRVTAARHAAPSAASRSSPVADGAAVRRSAVERPRPRPRRRRRGRPSLSRRPSLAWVAGRCRPGRLAGRLPGARAERRRARPSAAIETGTRADRRRRLDDADHRRDHGPRRARTSPDSARPSTAAASPRGDAAAVVTGDGGSLLGPAADDAADVRQQAGAPIVRSGPSSSPAPASGSRPRRARQHAGPRAEPSGRAKAARRGAADERRRPPAPEPGSARRRAIGSASSRLGILRRASGRMGLWRSW